MIRKYWKKEKRIWYRSVYICGHRPDVDADCTSAELDTGALNFLYI